MGLNQYFSNEEVQIVNKYMKKMFNILSHHGNANQNYAEIPPHSSHGDYHQENKQEEMLMSTRE
jgi:hypothetical protein